MHSLHNKFRLTYEPIWLYHRGIQDTDGKKARMQDVTEQSAQAGVSIAVRIPSLREFLREDIQIVVAGRRGKTGPPGPTSNRGAQFLFPYRLCLYCPSDSSGYDPCSSGMS